MGEPPDGPAPDRATRRAVIAAVLGGLAVRIWLLTLPIGALDSDEAVTALMAEGFLDGQLSVFFWGQSYGGTLDSIATALVFVITGPSVVAAKSVMVVCHAVACAAAGRAARRWTHPNTAAIGAATAWVLSPGVIWFSTKTRGFYGAGIVLAMVVVLLVARLMHRESGDENGRLRQLPGLRSLDIDAVDLSALGLAVGLAWWTSPLVFMVAGPAVLVGVTRRLDLVRRVGWAVGGFVIGSAPWLAVNLTRGFPSLNDPGSAEPSTYLDRLEGLVTRLLPTLLGLRGPYSGDWVAGPVGIGAGAVAIVAIALTAWTQRRQSWILAGTLAGFAVLFAVPSATAYVTEPRYGYMVSPLLAIGVAMVLARWSAVQRLVPVLLVATSAAGLWLLNDWGTQNPGHWDLDPPDLAQVDDYLDDQGVEAVVADYWIAYRLAFETERLATPATGSRNPELDQAVTEVDRWAYVWHTDSATHLAQIERFEANAVPHREEQIGPLVVVIVGAD